jgi:hypothetical protein
VFLGLAALNVDDSGVSTGPSPFESLRMVTKHGNSITGPFFASSQFPSINGEGVISFQVLLFNLSFVP